MITDNCVACGSIINLNKHHLQPKSMGGDDVESNIIVLCGKCHAKVHGRHKSFNISELTRGGLIKAKQRGVKLGTTHNQNLTAEQRAAGRVLGTKAKREKADAFALTVKPIIHELLQKGLNYLQIAIKLNEYNVKTPHGKSWKCQSVINVIKRIKMIKDSVDRPLSSDNAK